MNRCAIVILAGLLAGCGGRPNRVDLGVDLYLHPQSGSAEDLILQAAIRKKISDTLPHGSGSVHVRVMDGTAFLSGTVVSEKIRDLVREAAEKIDIRLDGTPLKPQGVRAGGIGISR